MDLVRDEVPLLRVKLQDLAWPPCCLCPSLSPHRHSEGRLPCSRLFECASSPLPSLTSLAFPSSLVIPLHPADCATVQCSITTRFRLHTNADLIPITHQVCQRQYSQIGRIPDAGRHALNAAAECVVEMTTTAHQFRNSQVSDTSVTKARADL